MEDKSIYSFKAKVGNNDYLFLCPNEAPLGELYDVIIQLQSIVVKRMQDYQKMQADQAQIMSSDQPSEG